MKFGSSGSGLSTRNGSTSEVLRELADREGPRRVGVLEPAEVPVNRNVRCCTLSANWDMGSFILMDRLADATLGAGMLHVQGFHTYQFDGDNIRHGLNKDLGFTDFRAESVV